MRCLVESARQPPQSKPVAVSLSSVATNGIEHWDISVGGKSTVRVTEVGGGMFSLWRSYVEATRAVVYCIDASNPAGLSKSAADLYAILASSDCQAREAWGPVRM